VAKRGNYLWQRHTNRKTHSVGYCDYPSTGFIRAAATATAAATAATVASPRQHATPA